MNAITIYVNAAKLVLQLTDSNWSVVQDLCRILPQLRQLLVCAVCSRLANDPYVPRDGRCCHNVCRLCVRAQKKHQPLCNYCKDNRDYKGYDENKLLRGLLLCYKSLCVHVKTSSIYPKLLSGRKLCNAVGNMPQTLHELIIEGITYNEFVNNVNNCDVPITATATATTTAAPAPAPTPAKMNVISGIMKIPQLPTLVTPLSITAAVTPLPLSSPLPTSYQSTPPKASTPPTTNNIKEPVSTIIKLKREQYSQPVIRGQHKQQQQQQHQQSQSHNHAPPLQALTKTPTSPTPPAAPPPALTTQQSQAALTQLEQLQKTSSNITYIRPNARGIVVPIVSSSVTTSAPLTIASARLQSLTRQLAQAKVINTATSSSTISSPALKTVEVKTNSTIKSPHKVTLATHAATTTINTTRSITTLNNGNNNNNNNNSNVGGSGSCGSGTINSISTSICSVPIRNLPPIKTVSNGSAMYSVLYTGIGNKITIKRKTESDDDLNQKKTIAASTTVTTTQISSSAGTMEGPSITLSLNKALNKNNANKRRGCRCGNATPTPGKLTCCGQRCPCYVDSKSCINCKCRGCRNPHRPGGGKVRPVIPELACYEIQMADEHSNPLGSHDNPLSSNAINHNAIDIDSSINICNVANSNTTSTACSTNGGNNIPARSSNITSATKLLGYCENNNGINNNSNHIASPTLTGPTTHTIFSHHNVKPKVVTNTTNQCNSTTNILQLEHLPRESVLVQNAQGKYQILNLFTSSSPSTSSISNTQMTNCGQPVVPNLQRIHQNLSKINSGAIEIGAANTTHTMTSAIVTSGITSTSNSAACLPQIIMQAKQQQHQQQHVLMATEAAATQRHSINSSNSNINNNSNSNNIDNITTITSNNSLTLPLQLQQQLKPNIITVHAINTPMHAISNHINTHPNTSIITLTSNSTPIHTTANAIKLTNVSNEIRSIGTTTTNNLYTNPTNKISSYNLLNSTEREAIATAASTISNRNCTIGNIVSNRDYQNVTRTIRTAGIVGIFDASKTSNLQ